jgi:hypothetical protein
MVAAIISPVSRGHQVSLVAPLQICRRHAVGRQLTCGRVSASCPRGAVWARVRVVRQLLSVLAVLPVISLGLLLINLVRGRVAPRVLLVRRRSLSVVLVHNAWGSSVLQVGCRRALLRVVGVVLQKSTTVSNGDPSRRTLLVNDDNTVEQSKRRWSDKTRL